VLAVLTLTAVPMSYHWGNTLVYRLVGEEPPVRQKGPPTSPPDAAVVPIPPIEDSPFSTDQVLDTVQKNYPAWEEITLRLDGAASLKGVAGPPPVYAMVKLSNPWPRTATLTVVLNPSTGEALRTERFNDQSAGRQLRSWTRFLHTGEALGWPGQLVAGLASLGSCVLVYTGVALSCRRFFRRKKARTTAPSE